MQNIIFPLLLQIPTNAPNPGDSGTVDLSEPFDLIVFIILPIVFVILYFIWKRNKKRDRE
ncbi:adenylosuccinate synthetase [Gelidibacter algens]|uniref:adenylosuccinate synthetase n=1 Tax=Gelidibacter algens TaxID=49280 RepID=UPI00080546C2|nr:adenylosuccinate synthetase [Gelidibacter algens]OBX26482.1 adenylosuccinate synthetase [Gelidibacter algens]